MIRPDIIKAWVLGVLTFFSTQVLDPVLEGTAETVTAMVAIAVYVFVALYTFSPEKETSQERPSAVRSRLEAAQRRRGS